LPSACSCHIPGKLHWLINLSELNSNVKCI
jgi:hypothetical protein